MDTLTMILLAIFLTIIVMVILFAFYLVHLSKEVKEISDKDLMLLDTIKKQREEDVEENY